jgi:hypothetical protein
MITMQRTYTRPSTSVKWYVHSENTDRLGLASATTHIRNVYKETGLLILETMDFSDANALSVTYTSFWSDRASFDQYDNDPVLLPFWAVRNAYHDSVGITLSPKVFTINE